MSFPSTSNSSSSSSSSTAQKEACDGYVQSGLTGNRTVQFLLQNLINMGCTPPEGFIQCLDCEGKPVSGGFGMLQEETIVVQNNDDNNDNKNGSIHVPSQAQVSTNVATATTSNGSNRINNNKRPDCTKSRQELLDQFQRDKDGSTKLTLKPEIYLCQENVTGPKHAHTILVHELIHAIDICRAKVDPIRNCMQLACTEIRAENLSGECNPSWEFLRGRLSSILGHGQECVRRRAIDSVMANPNCTAQAENYVDAAMERCYADTFPFERHPNQR
jgi:hypothetical protein